ncbi:MAG: hypothetical protein FWG54_00305, partial [Bacteroidetes bacterium]|nr:hypothetical protein [Bacteroidota bacterium]
AVAKESFYLYFDMGNGSFWALPPEGVFPELDESYPVFVSPPNKTMIFTGRGPFGGLDFYLSRQLSDSLWSYPEPMEAEVNSTGDECFPVLSADGQSLYFASDGHYGMGGFDLYVSQFDKETGIWGPARNMGFPYSSPANDLLFMPTSDGLTALFASDRAKNQEMVTLYQVVYEQHPLSYDLRNSPDVYRLSQLLMVEEIDEKKANNAGREDPPSEQGALLDYTQAVQQAQAIREAVATQEKALTLSREVYARLSEENDRLIFAKRIEEEEFALMDLREQYRQAGLAVQQAETDFLNRGILPPLVSPAQALVKETKPQTTSVFSAPLKKEAATLYTFRFALPVVIEPTIDLSFRIDNESEIIPEYVRPDFLFYRIQLSVTSAPAKAASFKGVSPVFESATPTGKYHYAAGQFSGYDQASVALAQVKRTGLRDAVIIAYNEGNTITVAEARKLESAAPKAACRVSLGYYPQGLPESLIVAIRELKTKDLASISGDGGLKYVIGPFATFQEAQELQTVLTQLGFEGITVETIHP